jgi:hypothetical protein
MQLKKNANVRHALAAATCTLLGSVSQTSHAGEEHADWEFDSAVLYYSETDRVTAIEPIINAHREVGDDESVNLRLALDTLTGASANGAVATEGPQTFTSPSGNSSYITQSGETPLDDTFKDTRVALSGGWDKPLTQMIRSNLGAAFSKEFDYQSIGVNGLLSFDFNNRNTTLQTGLSYASDTIEPVGGTPTPFKSMAEPGEDQSRQDGTQNKNTADLLLGVTQVIDKNTVGQLSYSFSNSSGYQTDPYKIISLVDGDPASDTYGKTLDYVFEERPDKRLKHSLYGSIKHHFTNDIAEASYRFYTDDWGIDSHTLDLKYRKNLGNERYLEPHIRLYQQSATDFYQHSLTAIPGLGEYASADYRLGEFTATTLGLKYGMKFKNGNDLSLRGEYYLQTGDSNPDNAIGVQKTQDLYPDVNAIILQLNYSFRW